MKKQFQKLSVFLSQRRKAIAAALAPPVAALALRYGFQISIEQWQLWISMGLGMLAVHEVPNKPM